SITTTRASRRARATRATRRSTTSGGPWSCYRGSGKTRAKTTILPPYATTRGSRRLFAKSPGSTPTRREPTSAHLRRGAASRFLVHPRPLAQARIRRPTTELRLPDRAQATARSSSERCWRLSPAALTNVMLRLLHLDRVLREFAGGSRLVRCDRCRCTLCGSADGDASGARGSSGVVG